jgi:hypothetical protein
MTDPVAIATIAAILTMWLIAVILVLLCRALVREMRDERREHSEQIDRLLVLQRSETLDQFAAVERRRSQDRREEQRALMTPTGEPTTETEPKRRKASLLHSVFRRPKVPPPPAPETQEAKDRE